MTTTPNPAATLTHLLNLSAETIEEENAWQGNVLRTLAARAAQVGATDVQVRCWACPTIVTGTYAGHSFLVRERHGHYRVNIADAGLDLYDGEHPMRTIALGDRFLDPCEAFDVAVAAIQEA